MTIPIKGAQPNNQANNASAAQDTTSTSAQGQPSSASLVGKLLSKGSGVYRSVKEVLTEPRLRPKQLPTLGEKVKDALESRQIKLLDELSNRVFGQSLEELFAPLDYSRHFQLSELEDAIQLKAEWLGAAGDLQNYEKLEKWASNIHRLLLGDQHAVAAELIQSGLAEVVAACDKDDIVSSDAVVGKFTYFVADLLRNIPLPQLNEEERAAFFQKLFNELISHSDKGEELAEAITSTLVDTFIQSGFPVDKTQAAADRVDAIAPKFEVSWISSSISEGEDVFSSGNGDSACKDISAWVEGLHRLVSCDELDGFKSRLQQAVNIVYGEAERLLLSSEGRTATPEQIRAHPLWQGFRQLILSNFPEGKFFDSEKSDIHTLVTNTRPLKTKIQIVEALAKIKVEMAQLEQLSLTVNELTGRGVGYQGDIGRLQLEALKERLDSVPVEYQPDDIALWSDLTGQDQADGWVDITLQANKTEESAELSSNATSSLAIATSASHQLEGVAPVVGPYSVTFKGYVDANLNALGEGRARAHIPDSTEVFNSLTSGTLPPLLNLSAEAKVDASIKIGGELSAQIRYVDLTAQAELQAGAQVQGKAEAYLGPDGLGARVAGKAHIGVESTLEATAKVKSRFSLKPGITATIKLAATAGAGINGEAHAQVSRKGFGFGASSGVTLGVGGRIGHSVSGDVIGAQTLAAEVAANVARKVGRDTFISEALSQAGRVIALTDRVETLNEAIENRLHGLNELEQGFLDNLDKGQYRQSNAGSEKIELTEAQRAVLGSLQDPQNRARGLAQALFKETLGKHYGEGNLADK